MRRWFHKLKKNKKMMMLLIAIVFTLAFIFAGYFQSKDYQATIFDIVLREPYFLISKIFVRNNESKITSSNQMLMEENKALKEEIKELQEILKVQSLITDYEMVNATVISRKNLDWYHTLLINKGSSDGLTTGLAVINGLGLIGKVVTVTPHTSTIKLLTNNIKLSVLVNQNVYGVLSYYDNKRNIFVIEGISNLDNIEAGDTVMTTGLSEIFTKALMIGTVKKISYDSFGLSRILEVTPSVNYDNISFVAVLKRK